MSGIVPGVSCFRLPWASLGAYQGIDDILDSIYVYVFSKRTSFSNVASLRRRPLEVASKALFDAQVISSGERLFALEAVFEPFMRLDESRSEETGGAGLGLSIARTILRAHGGSITLANRADQSGLCATITLPTDRARHHR